MNPGRQLLLPVAGLWLAASLSCHSQELARQKLNTGHIPIETLRPALEKVLSPEGRFVILPGQGQILVIDRPENIQAATTAIAMIEAPAPQVALDFAVNTNVAPGMGGPQPVESVGGFPFPTRYQAPRVIQNGPNSVVVIPAHPTGFVKRNIGNTMETTGIANPDGTISLDINVEQVEFEGFINYGSAIFTSGIPGVMPVINGVGNPQFFAPLLNENKILVPIFRTTRINTQILVRPEVVLNQVRLDLVPQIEIESDEPGAGKVAVPFPQFRTTLGIQNGEVGKINGFTGASVDFNRTFLGAKEEDQGGTAIKIRASLRAGEAESPPRAPE